MPTNQRCLPVFLVIFNSRSAGLRQSIDTLRAGHQHEANVQVVETADAALSALSLGPAAIIVPDSSLNEQTFDRVRLEVSRYVQSGGRLITDLSQVASVFSLPREGNFDYVPNINVDLRKGDHMTAVSELHPEYLVK